MKRLFTYPCLLIFLLSCQGDLDLFKKQPISECVGHSTYYVANQSDSPLSVRFVTTRQLGSKTDSTFRIQSQETVKIAEDAMFGYIPKPTDTFASLTLSGQRTGGQAVAYSQNPVSNTTWVKQKKNATDPDFGCYAVSYTLTITNADLK
ncbi:hypothetical protein DYU11_08435 [Fibrisoma montanum]|uniref:Uncharacterized protein n=1 Tax=Fibrisoma montanum TaxID=2305895 RepID=A0A418MEU6_9BACT|nr:hypothetical protein DYU11_08435 [Fibrisoma montanum]